MNLERSCIEVEELLYKKMNQQFVCFVYSYILLLIGIAWTCYLYFNLEKNYIALIKKISSNKNITSTYINAESDIESDLESDSDTDSDSSINTKLNRSLTWRINRINLTKELKYLEDLKESKNIVLEELKFLQSIKTKKTKVLQELKLQKSKNNVIDEIKSIEKTNIDKQNVINELKITHNKENLLDELNYLEQLRLSKTNVIEELESIEKLKTQKLDVLNEIKLLNETDDNDVVNLETNDCVDNDSIYNSLAYYFLKEKTN